MPSAEENYARILTKLRGDTGQEDLSADCAKTIAAIDARYKFSTSKVALTALRKAYPACDAFLKEQDKRRDAWKAEQEAQEPTAAQKDKFLDWENILMFREAYKTDMSDAEYYALCLYTMWPPVRSDYTPMKVVQRKPKQLEDGMNYLIVHKSKIEVLFHAYKTAGKYGDLLRKMPKDLEAETRKWLAAHPGTYLFQDEAGNPWQEQRLGATVRKPFQRHYGLDTGITMLRHAYSTWVNQGTPSIKQLKENASSMMHGVMMNQAYRFLPAAE
jgi:hypothetical protein